MTISQAVFLGFVFGILWLLGMQFIQKIVDKKGHNDDDERKN